MAKTPPIEIKLVDSPVVRQYIVDQNKVIARLLDGWRPTYKQCGPLLDDGVRIDRWFRLGGSPRDDQFAEMSDGEASIIRQHRGRDAT